MNILLIEHRTADPSLATILAAKGYSLTKMPEAKLQPLDADNKTDMIIFNVDSPKNYFQYLSLNQTLPIIIFAADDSADTIDQVVKAGVSAYVVNGLEAGRIDSIINIAIARFKERQRLKTELDKTKAKLEERKLIDRAKGILTKTRGYSEDEAYHTLRKLAMDRNIAIGEMAKNVIAMAELLK